MKPFNWRHFKPRGQLSPKSPKTHMLLFFLKNEEAMEYVEIMLATCCMPDGGAEAVMPFIIRARLLWSGFAAVADTWLDYNTAQIYSANVTVPESHHSRHHLLRCYIAWNHHLPESPLTPSPPTSPSPSSTEAAETNLSPSPFRDTQGGLR